MPNSTLVELYGYLGSALPGEGMRQVTVAAATPDHGACLEKMGYSRSGKGYTKAL